VHVLVIASAVPRPQNEVIRVGPIQQVENFCPKLEAEALAQRRKPLLDLVQESD
jgi:hypothetical protein